MDGIHTYATSQNQQTQPAFKCKLTAIDPNGNFQNIGTATSDIFGNYAISWTPPVPGLYKVTATFEGSKSYYGCKAGTAFVVADTSAAPIAHHQLQHKQPHPPNHPNTNNFTISSYSIHQPAQIQQPPTSP